MLTLQIAIVVMHKGESGDQVQYELSNKGNKNGQAGTKF